MFSVLRPFLFNLDPETAHDLAIKSLKFNPLPSKMFEVEDEQMLKIELLGKNFPNPIGLAAGFDKSAEAYNSLLKLGFGLTQPSDVKFYIYKVVLDLIIIQCILTQYSNVSSHNMKI